MATQLLFLLLLLQPAALLPITERDRIAAGIIRPVTEVNNALEKHRNNLKEQSLKKKTNGNTVKINALGPKGLSFVSRRKDSCNYWDSK